MRLKFYITTLLLILAVASAKAQPRIMVNIVVGGLSQHDISRYEKNFSKDGFLRLRSGGVEFSECYANYAPTTSEAGLATLATGTLPAMHGLFSSVVFDRGANKFSVLCQKPKSEQTESVNKKVESGYTTQHFTMQTLAESVVASSKHNRAITIAHKPLSAMILAGRSGEGYWLGNNGKWASADCYMTELPSWVQKCNSDDINRVFATNVWYGRYVKGNYLNTNTTDILVYDQSNTRRQRSQQKATDGWVNKLLSMPSGNLAIFEFAKRAVTHLVSLKAEEGCSLLTICLDVPRTVVEKYGPDSIEYEDMLYSLDASLAEFLTFLYAQVSKPEDVAVVLASDGGVSPSERDNSDFVRFNTRQFEIIMNAFLSARYGQDSWVVGYSDGSLYLNHDVIYNHKKSVAEVQNEVANFALQYRGVAAVSTATGMRSAQFTSGIMGLVQNGYNPRRSGDVVIALEPRRIESDAKRVAMSGSAYSYDRHVPFMVYGAGIAPQRNTNRISTNQIASTLADLLGVQRPQCSDAEVVVLDNKK